MAIIHDIDFDAAGGPRVAFECGGCSAETTIKAKDLELGDKFAEGNPDMIVLPACTSCGAVGFLLRTWDKSTEADTPARRATNALAQWLVETNRGSAAHKGKHAALKGKAPPIMGARTGKLADIRGLRRARRDEKEQAVLEAAARAVEESAKPETPQEEIIVAAAQARRAALVKLEANRKAGREPDATPSEEELAKVDAELTARLGGK